LESEPACMVTPDERTMLHPCENELIKQSLTLVRQQAFRKIID
jgi:hypothetical protein